MKYARTDTVDRPSSTSTAAFIRPGVDTKGSYLALPRPWGKAAPGSDNREFWHAFLEGCFEGRTSSKIALHLPPEGLMGSRMIEKMLGRRLARTKKRLG